MSRESDIVIQANTFDLKTAVKAGLTTINSRRIEYTHGDKIPVTVRLIEFDEDTGEYSRQNLTAGEELLMKVFDNDTEQATVTLSSATDTETEQAGATQLTTISLPATADYDDLSGKTFALDVQDGDKYLFWFNVDGGNKPPTPTDRIMIEVPINNGSEPASQFSPILNGVSGVTTTYTSGTTFTLEQDNNGKPDLPTTSSDVIGIMVTRFGQEAVNDEIYQGVLDLENLASSDKEHTFKFLAQETGGAGEKRIIAINEGHIHSAT